MALPKRLLGVATIGALVLLLVGSNMYWIHHDRQDAGQVISAQGQESESRKYDLLSKRIFTEDQNDILLDFVPLRKQLEEKFSGLDVPYSFYFEYLPSGTSIRIGEDKELIAASLIKVPLAMNLYKAAEQGKIDLDETVTITEADIDSGYGKLWERGPGVRLTLREAVQLSLSESDNTATRVILRRVNGLLAPDMESLNNLDIDQNLDHGRAVINAKSYISILKSLYFSSYLQRDHSQEILGYLSRSTATNRLAKPLPVNVTVAHKIGVYNADWSESDCGIVYVTKRPYAVCIMVGLQEQAANEYIASISKTIYDYVAAQ